MDIVKLKHTINDGSLEIRLSIGENCNMSCSYCISKYSPKTFGKLPELLELIKRLDFKYLVLTISGGEPLLYIRKIFEIAEAVQKIISNKLKLVILTNGKLLKEDNTLAKLNILNKLYSLQLVISHHTLTSVIAFREIRIKLENSKIEFYTRKPIESEKIFREIIENKAIDEINDIFPTFYNRTLLKPESRLFRIYMHSKKQFDGNFSQIDVFEKTNFNFKGWECDSGKNLICINTDGNVFPCSIYLQKNIKTENSNVSMDEFKQKPTICNQTDCWCFTSCKTKIK